MQLLSLIECKGDETFFLRCLWGGNSVMSFHQYQKTLITEVLITSLMINILGVIFHKTDLAINSKCHNHLVRPHILLYISSIFYYLLFSLVFRSINFEISETLRKSFANAFGFFAIHFCLHESPQSGVHKINTCH